MLEEFDNPEYEAGFIWAQLFNVLDIYVENICSQDFYDKVIKSPIEKFYANNFSVFNWYIIYKHPIKFIPDPDAVYVKTVTITRYGAPHNEYIYNLYTLDFKKSDPIPDHKSTSEVISENEFIFDKQRTKSGYRFSQSIEEPSIGLIDIRELNY